MVEGREVLFVPWVWTRKHTPRLLQAAILKTWREAELRESQRGWAPEPWASSVIRANGFFLLWKPVWTVLFCLFLLAIKSVRSSLLQYVKIEVLTRLQDEVKMTYQSVCEIDLPHQSQKFLLAFSFPPLPHYKTFKSHCMGTYEGFQEYLQAP